MRITDLIGKRLSAETREFQKKWDRPKGRTVGRETVRLTSMVQGNQRLIRRESTRGNEKHKENRRDAPSFFNDENSGHGEAAGRDDQLRRE